MRGERPLWVTEETCTVNLPEISCVTMEKTVMEAILKQDRVVPDCFVCGTCIDVCPTKSVSFASGKRTPPHLTSLVATSSGSTRIWSRVL